MMTIYVDPASFVAGMVAGVVAFVAVLCVVVAVGNARKGSR